MIITSIYEKSNYIIKIFLSLHLYNFKIRRIDYIYSYILPNVGFVNKFNNNILSSLFRMSYQTYTSGFIFNINGQLCRMINIILYV